MIKSFIKYHTTAKVYVLALDLETKSLLEAHFEKDINVVCLLDNPVLLEAFNKFIKIRSFPETIFTLKFYWIKYLIDLCPVGTKILYADSDLYFMARVQDLENNNWSVLLSPHAFPPHRQNLLDSGYYNAGCIGIRVTSETKQMISWWEAKVTEYCGLSKAGGLYADQKYLDLLPHLFEGVLNFSQPGTNVGMWQICSAKRIKKIKHIYYVGSTTLNSFHFHGYRISKFYIRKGMTRYGVPFNSLLAVLRLYREYKHELFRLIGSNPKIDLGVYGHKISLRNEFSKYVRNPKSILDISLPISPSTDRNTK